MNGRSVDSESDCRKKDETWNENGEGRKETTSFELPKRLKVVDCGIAYFVRGTVDQDSCTLSPWLLGDMPIGPRKTWA